MAIIRIFATLLIACLAVPAMAETPPTQWDVTDAARSSAERDYEWLKNQCRDLFNQYTDDIESVEIRAPAAYRPANAPATYIRVKILDDARLIPPAYRAWGHALHYYVRVGGISVQKDQSWQVCGWPAVAPAGDDAFYPLSSAASDSPR